MIEKIKRTLYENQHTLKKFVQSLKFPVDETSNRMARIRKTNVGVIFLIIENVEIKLFNNFGKNLNYLKIHS